MSSAFPYVGNGAWVDDTTDVTAARMNLIEQGLKDAHQQPAVRAYHGSNQSLADSTWTTLALNNERFDQAGGGAATPHDNSTNNSRLTCRYAGIYLITATVQIGTGTGGTDRGLRILLNGASVIGKTEDVASAYAASLDVVLNCSALWSLAVNDYVEMQAFQNSGGSKTVYSVSGVSPEISMVRVG